MNSREKILAVTIVGLLALLVVYLGYSQITGQFQQRESQITNLNKDIKLAKRLKSQGGAAEKRLHAYREQALPADLNDARRKYQQWLRDRVATSGLAKTVKPVPSRTTSNVYQQLTYNVTGLGTLDQLTDFLYSFYSVDELHRIRSLIVKPSGSKQLDINMTIDALLMPDAEKLAIGERNSSRVTLAKDEYFRAIVDRNPFSPANQPPRLRRLRRQEVALGEDLSVLVEAEDPDDDDLTFELGDDAPEGLEIDEATGRLRWNPTEIDDYEFLVTVHDDGLPRKSDERTIRVSVVEPSDDSDDDGVDKAEFAFVAGIVERDGQPLMMLNLRTEDRTRRLKKGDEVDVGSFAGVITRIAPKEIELSTDDGPMVVRLGQSLADAKKIGGNEL